MPPDFLDLESTQSSCSSDGSFYQDRPLPTPSDIEIILKRLSVAENHLAKQLNFYKELEAREYLKMAKLRRADRRRRRRDRKRRVLLNHAKQDFLNRLGIFYTIRLIDSSQPTVVKKAYFEPDEAEVSDTTTDEDIDSCLSPKKAKLSKEMITPVKRRLELEAKRRLAVESALEKMFSAKSSKNPISLRSIEETVYQIDGCSKVERPVFQPLLGSLKTYLQKNKRCFLETCKHQEPANCLILPCGCVVHACHLKDDHGRLAKYCPNIYCRSLIEAVPIIVYRRPYQCLKMDESEAIHNDQPVGICIRNDCSLLSLADKSNNTLLQHFRKTRQRKSKNMTVGAKRHR